MSYESQAVDALHDAAAQVYAPTLTAGKALAAAYSSAKATNDIVAVLAALTDLVTAARDLHDAADHAMKQLREAMTEVMASTGATRIEGARYTAHLQRKPAFISISDEALIPRTYFVQPPPKLDTSALKDALKNGTEVPGATLAIPNEQTLVLRPNKEASP